MGREHRERKMKTQYPMEISVFKFKLSAFPLNLALQALHLLLHLHHHHLIHFPVGEVSSTFL